VSLLHHRYVPPPDGVAPTLLLIHPMGAALQFWDACLPAWQGRYGLLAMDLRCAGASPCATEPPGLVTHAEDIETLRAAVGATRLVPVACAVGCMVAAAYAARHPAAVTAMVLSNPTARSTDAAREALQARAAAVQQGGMAAILPAAVERPFASQPRDARYAAYLAAFAAQNPLAYAQSVLGFATADARLHFARVACPTLLVPAAHDLLLPPPLAEEVAVLMPPGLARIALDAEGAHFLPYQRPAAFAARVVQFLDHLPAQSATQGA
jgi:3-oxoadipate enol-lactonase